jgi:hypothetical protein
MASVPGAARAGRAQPDLGSREIVPYGWDRLYGRVVALFYTLLHTPARWPAEMLAVLERQAPGWPG